ncbi:MAG: phosphotransferase, partial [Acidimicrobiales bacterium]
MSPRTGFSSFSPVFPVKDMRRALSHYASLGFTANASEEGADYGFAERDGTSLHLAELENYDPTTGFAQAYLYVDDADALYSEWARTGVGGTTRPVHDTPYKLREGSHTDPDGNLIRFGSPMPRRSEQDGLRSHLEVRYGVEVSSMSVLDLGVYRVDLASGVSWVARYFPEERTLEAAEGDAQVLRYLASCDYPAERLATAELASICDRRPVVVTGWVEDVPREKRRDAIKAAGGLRRFGELLGVLHNLPDGAGAPSHAGGAWHHLADGGPSAEIAAAERLLSHSEHLVPVGEWAAYESLRSALDGLDGGLGLPQALTHPDFVLPNTIANPEVGLVLVDWTGAGPLAVLAA